MGFEEAIKKAVFEIRKTEEKKLEELYAATPTELKKIERDKLIELSLEPKMAAMEKIPNILEALKIPQPYLCWKKISEKISMIPYLYIDWNSSEAVKSGYEGTEYQHEMTQEEMETLDKGGTVWLTRGSLVAGTVALVNLLVKGKPVITIVSVVIAAGGFLLKKICEDDKNTKRNPDMSSNGLNSVKQSHIKKSSSETDLIHAAKTENMKLLNDWCENLQTLTIETCREVLK